MGPRSRSGRCAIAGSDVSLMPKRRSIFRRDVYDDWLRRSGVGEAVSDARPGRGIDRHSDVWVVCRFVLRDRAGDLHEECGSEAQVNLGNNCARKSVTTRRDLSAQWPHHWGSFWTMACLLALEDRHEPTITCCPNQAKLTPAHSFPTEGCRRNTIVQPIARQTARG